MSAVLSSFIISLALLSPVMALGLVPASFHGMTRRPALAVPYAAAGSALILLFSILGWSANRLMLETYGFELLKLPVLILLLWAVHAGIAAVLGRNRSFREHLPVHFVGCLALGCCLYIIRHYQVDLRAAFSTAAGMSFGFLISTMVLSFLRERLETREMPAIVRGWPVLLFLCSLFWLASKGAGSLLP